MSGVSAEVSRWVTIGAPLRNQTTTRGSGGIGLADCPRWGAPILEKISGKRRNSLLGSKVVSAETYVNGAATRTAPSRASPLEGLLWKAGVEEKQRLGSAGEGVSNGNRKDHLILRKVMSLFVREWLRRKIAAGVMYPSAAA